MTPARASASLLLAALLAGCNGPVDASVLTAASLEGSVIIGDAFVVEATRLSVAPASEQALGTALARVFLSDPPAVARTNMTRDHWVLEARILERAADAANASAVNATIRLDWNGAPAGEVHLATPAGERRGELGIVVRFDVGAQIERSNVYAFELLTTT